MGFGNLTYAFARAASAVDQFNDAMEWLARRRQFIKARNRGRGSNRKLRINRRRRIFTSFRIGQPGQQGKEEVPFE